MFWTRDGNVDIDLSQANAMSGAVLKAEEGVVLNLIFSSNTVEGVDKFISANATISKHFHGRE